jgi:CrcB protein
MWTYVAIAIGGTLGCWARYAQSVYVQATFGRDFPLATLSINLIGSFLMGFLFILTLERLMIPPSVRVGGSERRLGIGLRSFALPPFAARF